MNKHENIWDYFVHSQFYVLVFLTLWFTLVSISIKLRVFTIQNRVDFTYRLGVLRLALPKEPHVSHIR